MPSLLVIWALGRGASPLFTWGLYYLVFVDESGLVSGGGGICVIFELRKDGLPLRMCFSALAG